MYTLLLIKIRRLVQAAFFKSLVQALIIFHKQQSIHTPHSIFVVRSYKSILSSIPLQNLATKSSQVVISTPKLSVEEGINTSA